MARASSLRIGIIGVLATTAAIVPGVADAQYGGAPHYDGGPRYSQPAPGYGGGNTGQGHGARGYYRHRCRSDGAGGAVLGAIAGGLLGNSIAGRGDRAAGTIIGAGGGALVGRAIDRDC